MTELRHRGAPDTDPPSDDKGSESELKDGASDSDSKVDSGIPEVPVPSDDTPEVLNKALSGLSSRYFLLCVNYFFYGFCMFVLSLVKKHYRLQFYMFGWTHVTLLIVVTQSHLIIHNLFEGMIWFIVPISCVICNDIMAYMFGFFFGRTPLIKLSPKKTWEGFIGGFFATVVFGILLSYVMAGYCYFVCPVEFNNDTNRFQTTDFADTIPGHGGIMDRFDCQYLMATFVNVYIASFIRGPNPSKVIQQLLALRPDQQLFIFNSLKTHLTERGLLPALEEAVA
ncbi:hypothetical protein CRUP_009211 [Coryphaenoides rupestris]|nr:hypothetical protein CRUP_009211 [Coryphaenoides rupestris]